MAARRRHGRVRAGARIEQAEQAVAQHVGSQDRDGRLKARPDARRSGAVMTRSWAPVSMLPQLGTGGCDAQAEEAQRRLGQDDVADGERGRDDRAGRRRWAARGARMIARGPGAEGARGGDVVARSSRLSTLARTRRAAVVQPKRATISDDARPRRPRPARRAPRRQAELGRIDGRQHDQERQRGSEMTASVRRISSASSAPPAEPATRPTPPADHARPAGAREADERARRAPP